MKRLCLFLERANADVGFSFYLRRFTGFAVTHPLTALSSLSLFRDITKTCPCNILRFFMAVKKIIYYVFLIFAQNINCGGSNEYPQSMFWSKNKKKMYTPVNPSFRGVRGSSLHGLVFVMFGAKTAADG